MRFKVWAPKGFPAGRKFSKHVLRAKKYIRRDNKVAELFQKTLKKISKKRTFFSFFVFLFFFFFSTSTAVLKRDGAAKPLAPEGRSQ